MITAVDTSVTLDILTAAPSFEPSLRIYRRCIAEGKLIACPIVWSELRPFFATDRAMEIALEKMHLVFDDFGQPVATQAGAFWQQYRKAKGPRERLVADFLIGAHALVKADRLLTRDRGFYKTYFRELSILDPTAA